MRFPCRSRTKSEAHMSITRDTLKAVFEEFGCYPELAPGIDELVDPQFGVISSFEDIIRAVNTLKEQDLDETSPF